MLLEVRNLRVEFPASPRPVAAVRDVSFKLPRGGVLGLVGESGSGKSVTSLAIMRLLPPSASIAGDICLEIDGASKSLFALDPEPMRALRGSRMTMIFQEPMTALNPVMRVGDQIAEAVRAHNNDVSRKEARDRAVEALNEVAIHDAPHRAKDYPHQLSGGMRQRVMIAMAIVNRPELLIADEPTTALDVTVQAQILDLLSQLREKFGLAMLFISHDLAVMSHVADQVGVMYAGTLVELGSREEIFRAPAHPYTRGLLQAVPTLKSDRARPLQTIEGSVPPIAAVPAGCPFDPRCDLRVEDCARELPALEEVSPSHWARCPVTLQASGFRR